jgi:hypothetical protein
MDYITTNKYLANALSFIGFRYYIFNNADTTNIKSYSFRDSKELYLAMGEIMKVRSKYNNKQ